MIEQEQSFGIIPLRRTGKEWEVLLILHLHGNHWSFPKGKMDPGESPKEGAVRELLEETGLEIDQFLSETPLVEEYSFSRRGKRVIKRVTYYAALVKGELRLQPEEIRQAKWLNIQTASDYLTFKEAKNICEQVKKLLHAQN